MIWDVCLLLGQLMIEAFGMICFVQAGVSGSLTEPAQVQRDIDLSPGQPLQANQSSGSLGVIGRRSVSDLGAIGDNLTGSAVNTGGMHDQLYNLQMLENAYYKLPQPKDSERARTYTPVWMHAHMSIFLFCLPCSYHHLFSCSGTLQ